MKKKFLADVLDYWKYAVFSKLVRERIIDKFDNIAVIAMFTGPWDKNCERVYADVLGVDPSRVFKPILIANDRQRYWNDAITFINESKARFTFVDPDNGVEPKNYEASDAHLTLNEISRILNETECEMLLLFQHAWYAGDCAGMKETQVREHLREQCAEQCAVYLLDCGKGIMVFVSKNPAIIESVGSTFRVVNRKGNAFHLS